VQCAYRGAVTLQEGVGRAEGTANPGGASTLAAVGPHPLGAGLRGDGATGTGRTADCTRRLADLTIAPRGDSASPRGGMGGRYPSLVVALARSRPIRRRIPRVLVLGDLLLDVVLCPARPLERGSDVPGRVLFRQGGSAATTARWLARAGVKTQLVCAVGRDPIGRALVAALRADGVVLRAIRVAGRPTGRIGVLVAPEGERSFVADRGAADELHPDELREDWFRGLDLLHLPAYSLLGEPLGQAGRRAVQLARSQGAAVSLDLASIAPLLARGRRAAHSLVAEVGADLLFATLAETEAFLGRYSPDGLLAFAKVAVVKRGARGATILVRDGPAPGGRGEHLRFDVATSPLPVVDTTGAGDAFDGGFLAAWLTGRSSGRLPATLLRRAAVAGHRTAARHLRGPRPELALGTR
jgi:sugar/nucleoside kinase (ribokinase family)